MDVVDEHGELSDALFDDLVAESETAIARGAISNSFCSIAVETKFHQSGAGGGRLKGTEILGWMMRDDEGVGNGGNETSEVSNTCVTFVERATGEASCVFRGAFRKFGMGCQHLHIDIEPVTKVPMCSIIVVLLGGSGGGGVAVGEGDDRE
jgi:hypothetical protein